MKLSSVVAAALTMLGAADAASRVVVLETKNPSLAGFIPYGTTTYYGHDDVRHGLGFFTDGCKSWKYPWMKTICLDPARKRGHIIYASGAKDCYDRTYFDSWKCGGPEACYRGSCPTCEEARYTLARCP